MFWGNRLHYRDFLATTHPSDSLHSFIPAFPCGYTVLTRFTLSRGCVRPPSVTASEFPSIPTLITAKRTDLAPWLPRVYAGSPLLTATSGSLTAPGWSFAWPPSDSASQRTPWAIGYESSPSQEARWDFHPLSCSAARHAYTNHNWTNNKQYQISNDPNPKQKFLI